MMNTPKCHLKKDDKVKVMAGKDAGKIGKILRIDRKKCRVVVEHVNMIKKHTRANMKNSKGGIVETEAPIHWSKVMLMCNHCMAPIRIQTQVMEDGKKVRVCRKCNEQIDK